MNNKLGTYLQSLRKQQNYTQAFGVQKNVELYQLAKSEQELICCYRELDKRGQDDIQMLVEMLAKKGRK